MGARCEKITSSTKPEVHNISHCRERRTKPRPQVGLTHAEDFVTFGHVLFEICERTDRQTNTDTIFRTTAGSELKIVTLMSLLSYAKRGAQLVKRAAEDGKPKTPLIKQDVVAC